MRKVYIVGNDYGITKMFMGMGWQIVNYVDQNVSLIQFTGGADVDPSYYGETKHPRTYSDVKRDALEAAVFNEWKGKVPMAGICRGAQFLNVMSGGKMWQHVNNHATGQLHEAYDTQSGEVFMVTSTHHQMMRPASSAKILLTTNICTSRETADTIVEGEDVDVEAVFYKDTMSLCFQPHPEYVSINHPCQRLYFDYVEKYLL